MAWNLNVTVIVDCGSEESMGVVTAALPTFGIHSERSLHCTSYGATEVALPTIILLEKYGVDIWWPRGYGGQSLYDLTVGHCVYTGKGDRFW